MEQQLAAFLSPRLANGGEIAISNLFRIPGGASRETWMFDAAWGESRAAFVLRKDPPASLLDTDREAEWGFYTSFAGTNVPVPGMRWLEADAAYLGGPFFIMDRLLGIEAQPRRLMTAAFADARPRIAHHLYEILANIHCFDWRGTPVERVAECPPLDGCWKKELDHWERIIDDNEISPQPIMRAGIRWLRANPPPPADHVAVVHGDYRVGNVLCQPDGDIAAVVDWEMAHLGDPIEDLAWSFNESWQWMHDGRPGGVATKEEAIALYEANSGLPVDRRALQWWLAFCDVKCQGIWLTGTRRFQEHKTAELILPLISYTLINSQDQALLRSLGRWS